MEQTKRTLSRRADLANQEAIVQRVLSNTNSTRRFEIPGGRTQLLSLLKPENIEKLSDAVYTWLRGCRYFSEVTVSLADDRSRFNLHSKKIEDFETKGKFPLWVTHEEGKRTIAKRIADALQSHKLVAVKVDKTGVFIQTSEKFIPLSAATQETVDSWLTSHEGKECPFTVGDSILSDEWNPNIEFLPSERAQYGHGTV